MFITTYSTPVINAAKEADAQLVADRVRKHFNLKPYQCRVDQINAPQPNEPAEVAILHTPETKDKIDNIQRFVKQLVSALKIKTVAARKFVTEEIDALDSQKCVLA